MEVFRKIYPGEFYKKFLVHKIRPDDRALTAIRKTTISVGSATSAYGSSFVTMGGTSVMCGIRAEVGVIPPETETSNKFDKGHLVVNLEMLPLCSPFIRSGKPIEKAQAVAQTLNDILMNVLDTSNLNACRTKENDIANNVRAAWYIYADLYCFNHDGNILDASLVAIIAALKTTTLPEIHVTPAGEACVSADPKDRPITLKLNHHPIATTFGIFEEHVLADPNLEEEGLLDGTITVVFNETGTLCSLIKAGGTDMTEDQMKECMSLGSQRVSPILHLMNKVIAASSTKK